jgi:hypothetical protein
MSNEISTTILTDVNHANAWFALKERAIYLLGLDGQLRTIGADIRFGVEEQSAVVEVEGVTVKLQISRRI